MEILTLMLMVIVLFVALWIVVLAFVKYWYDIKKFAPEAKTFKKARMKKLSILELSDTSGRIVFGIGTKRKKSDVHFQGSEYGIQIDPKLQGNAPENRTVDGVPIHHFSTQYPFSMSDKNARALETIVEYARNNFPELNFLMDSDILILANTPRDNLDHDINNYIMEFEPEVEREVLSKQFNLNENFTTLFFGYDLIEELNRQGLDVGYKPLFDINMIVLDKKLQEALINYLNMTFDWKLKPKKLSFSIPNSIIFNWKDVIEGNETGIINFLKQKVNAGDGIYKLQANPQHEITLINGEDTSLASLKLDKRRRKVSLTIGNTTEEYKYKRDTGDVIDEVTKNDNTTLLQITDKKNNDVVVTFERGDNNMCYVSSPLFSVNSIEFGVISDNDTVGIPDATFEPTNDNEYELTTTNGNKYAIVSEDSVWNVYKQDKATVKLTKKDVIEQVSQLQEQIQTVPIKTGFFSYTYAFNNSPMGMLAQDMHQLSLLITRLTREEMKGEWEKYVPLAFAVLIIVVAIIAIITVLGRSGVA